MEKNVKRLNRILRHAEVVSLRPAYIMIIVWMISAFVAFGIIANLIENYGVLYNLGQGVFISLFSGGCLYLYFRLRDSRRKITSVASSHEVR
jgi:hypothetical protein